MRAIYACLPVDFDNDGDGKKAEWRSFFRQKLEELTIKEQSNRLSNPEKRNTAYKVPSPPFPGICLTALPPPLSVVRGMTPLLCTTLS
jgi:hypothetical protein